MAPTPAQKLQQVTMERNQVQAIIDRIHRWIEPKLSTATRFETERRLESLEAAFHTYNKCQSMIEQLDENAFLQNDREEIESVYFECCALMQTRLQVVHATERNPTEQNIPNDPPSCQVKLPKIQPPIFNGDYATWLTFYTKFKALVHDKPYDVVYKFETLRNCLSGIAAEQLRDMEITENNYQEAIEMLYRRWNNPKLIAQAHLRNIFEVSPIKNLTSESIISLINTILSNLRALKSLGRPTMDWDDLINYIILSKLDPETKLKWDEASSATEIPTLRDLTSFLEKRAQTLQSAAIVSSNKPKGSDFQRQDKNYRKGTHLASDTSSSVCNYCDIKGHSIFVCRKFQKLSVNNRRKAVKEKNLCFNCLFKGHTLYNCQKEKCTSCHGSHHKLLHENPMPSTSSVQSYVANRRLNKGYCLLSTAVIEVKDKYGKYVKARALIDSGSQMNFVTEEMTQILGIKRLRSKCSVGTIGCGSESSNQVVNLNMKSCHSNYSTSIEAAILTRITDSLPDHAINPSLFQVPPNIALADPHFTEPARIDILLGKSIEIEIRLPGRIQLTSSSLYLENSEFGWLAGGNIVEETHSPLTSRLSGCAIINQYEDCFDMKQFWQLEEVDQNCKKLSTEEQSCEDKFVNTVTKNSDGYYEVALPFRSNKNDLGISKNVALRRLNSLINRLKRDPIIYKMYSEFINEYEQLGHMVLVPPQEIELVKNYIPHQHVLRPSSSTTKLRVVFDASAKTSTNLSLNDTLMVGPVVQSDLFSILCRYRTYPVVFSVDVEKMYRQIRVTDKDSYYQCIFWKHPDKTVIDTYRLVTVTYGTSCAPYLATRTLKQLAYEYSDQYPSASQILIDNTYVDDILAGANTLNEALEKREELTNLFKSCNMNLRKWSSNSTAFLEGIPDSDREILVQIGDKSFMKTLGMAFNPRDDCFTYSINVDVDRSITKRTISSDIAKIYDPLGLISPVVTATKIILQKLWLLKLNWDDSPDTELSNLWKTVRSELHVINDLQIPRPITVPDEIISLQLYGFSDACESAYGACIYLRSVTSSKYVSTHLVCAKSRIAPLQPVVSLPRLELCAFELLCRLVRRLNGALSLELDKIHLWTDSTITLGWVTSQASQYKSFVANRVGKIHEIINFEQFKSNYVPTKQNPADIVSRGTTPNKLIADQLWFHGPEFLKFDESKWPKLPNISRSALPDLRKKKYTLLSISFVDLTKSIDIKYHHSFTKLSRIFSYVHRFISNCSKTRKITSNIHHADSGITLIVSTIQHVHFNKEISILKSGQVISQKSSLKSLAPFIDENQLLRVGGRLKNSILPSDSKHQLLLPSNHFVTSAIFRYYHHKHLHCGPLALLAAVRSRFWVVGGRNIAKRTVWSCSICFMAKPRPLNPFMGQLPSARLQPGLPFNSVCVDYVCGLQAHQRGRGSRPFKVYVCVFVCMKTRAVHFELVGELSTRAFIAALRRIIGRRGIISDLYCDNGTNFVGAKNELKVLESLFMAEKHQDDVKQYCLDNHMNVHFCPPKGPHFNGLAEAGVKSFKHHLLRVAGQAHLTFEELNTLTIQIESILNSRPITELSSDPNDYEALTPGHFLIGRPLTSFPEPQPDWSGTLLHQYHRICQLTHHFWQRWRFEYLNTLQQRTKWQDSIPNIKLGQLVVVKEDNVPPLYWSLGRVVKLSPGTDKVVRVVTIKTRSGIYDRPIVKICPLPCYN